ncbi:MAG: hypothetical protein GY864_01655 [Desulfobacterales bacterium]|nr:hypothetical protein [Desulfobacterales bacterium]
MKTGKLLSIIVALVWSLLLFPGLANAQPWLYNGSDIYYTAGNVGIGTSTPTAMFELGKTTISDVTMAVTGTTTTTQGLNWTQKFAKPSGNINVFRFRPGIAPTGAMNNAYVITASPRLQSTDTINQVNVLNVGPGADAGAGNTVTDLRYYYCGPFDDDSSGGATITNMYGLYVGDLTYATNNYAVYTLGGQVVFNENGGDNDFRVEGDTDANLFFVDASTDRIGIGTSAPYTALDVAGVITATGGDSDDWDAAYDWGDHSTQGYLTIYTETDPVWTAAIANYYTKTNMQTSGQSQLHWANLTNVPAGFADGVDNTGGGGLWTAGGGDIYRESGNVGVGITNPSEKLHVNGDLKLSGNIVSDVDICIGTCP